MSEDTRPVSVVLKVLGESEKGYKVSQNSAGIGPWLPKSKVSCSPREPKPGDESVFTMPQWLAYRKGLI